MLCTLIKKLINIVWKIKGKITLLKKDKGNINYLREKVKDILDILRKSKINGFNKLKIIPTKC